MNIIWLQGVTCNGNTHSFLNHPHLATLLDHFTLIHHPVLPCAHTLRAVMEKDLPCDILIIEGAIQDNLNRADHDVLGRIIHYAAKANHIIAAGTCASFGGIHRQIDPEHIGGLVFQGDESSGPLMAYRDKIINLPGCPIHPEWLANVLLSLRENRTPKTDALLRPLSLYAYLVHNGCLRNEYFEWKVDAKHFGTKEGCLYYEQGCQAPYTHGSCNKILWNGVSSKTRAGTPCLGCTEPTFPKRNLFETLTHMSIPATMPEGIPKRTYLTVSGVAKSFHIKRLESPLIPKKSDA